VTRLDLTWTLPPEHPARDHRQVHVWRTALDLPASCVQALAGMLERGELERAQRFSTSEDRWRYIVARAVLRAILARYLDCQPDRVRFSRGPFGKPMVAGESVSRGLRFNVSHAHKLALYAVSRDREVGVDLEHIRANLATRSVAERLFSARARAFLSSLPPGQFAEGFFTCWTRQEAYLKARGCGLGCDGYEEPEEGSGWLVADLRPGPGYIGALAVEGEHYQLHCWDWAQAPGFPGEAVSLTNQRMQQVPLADGE